MHAKLRLADAIGRAADAAAAVRASEGTIKPGTNLLFSNSPYAIQDAGVLSGFCLPEPDGVWTSGKSSEIEVRLRDAVKGVAYTASLYVFAFEHGNYQAEVFLSADDGSTRIAVPGRLGWVKVAVPCQLDFDKSPVRAYVRIEISNPCSPAELGLGADNRAVGLKVHGVCIEASEADAETSVVQVELLPSPTGEGISPQLANDRVPQAVPAAARGWRGRLLPFIHMTPIGRVARWMRRVSYSLVRIEEQSLSLQGRASRLEEQVSEIWSSSTVSSVDALERVVEHALETRLGLLHQRINDLELTMTERLRVVERGLEGELGKLGHQVGGLEVFVAERIAGQMEAVSASGTLSRLDERVQHLMLKADSVESLAGSAHPKLDNLLRRREPRVHLQTPGGWIVQTPTGFFSCALHDELLAICLIDSGDVERGLRLLLGELLVEGNVFVDVGANIGLHSVVAARAVGASGHVHAIEGIPETVGHLRRSLQLSGVEHQVTVHAVAAGARQQSAQPMYMNNVSGHSSLFDLDDAQRTVFVDVVRLDEIVGSRVDLVKIDVEGAELDVIAGMDGIFAGNPYVSLIVEFSSLHLQRSGASLSDWYAMLKKFDFQVYEIDDLDGQCRKVADLADLTDRVSVNLFLTRSGSAASRVAERA